MKRAADLLPALLFFGGLLLADARPDIAAFAAAYFGAVGVPAAGARSAALAFALGLAVIGTTLQLAWLLARGRRIGLLLWVGLALVAAYVAASAGFREETFAKWKPSVLFWALGLALWTSQVVFRRNLLRELIGAELVLPARVWQRLNFAWVACFATMGWLNLLIAHTFPTEIWLDFKRYGSVGLPLLFALCQVLLLGRRRLRDGSRPGGQGVATAPER